MLFRNRGAAQLVIDCLLLVAVMITVWRIGALWLANQQPNPALTETLMKSIQPGARIVMSDVRWVESPQNVVLFLRTTCPGSNNSVEFYRRLTALADLKANVRFVIVSDEPEKEVRQWLTGNSVFARHVVHVPAFMSLGVEWTPTLLIVADDGVVTDLMIGELSERDEEGFMARLSRATHTESLNNLPVLQTISDGEFRQSFGNTRQQVIDVRERDVYNGDHRTGAVNIPADELGTRAAIELAAPLPVFVDCSVEILQRMCRKAAYDLVFRGFSQVVMIVP